MSNPLIIEIASLHDLIEKQENEYMTLINSGSDENVLQRTRTTIEELKQRLQALEDILLDDRMRNL